MQLFMNHICQQHIFLAEILLANREPVKRYPLSELEPMWCIELYRTIAMVCLCVCIINTNVFKLKLTLFMEIVGQTQTMALRFVQNFELKFKWYSWGGHNDTWNYPFIYFGLYDYHYKMHLHPTQSEPTEWTKLLFCSWVHLAPLANSNEVMLIFSRYFHLPHYSSTCIATGNSVMQLRRK